MSQSQSLLLDIMQNTPPLPFYSLTPLHSVASRLAQLLCCSSINAAAAAALIKEWDEKDAEKEEEL